MLKRFISALLAAVMCICMGSPLDSYELKTVRAETGVSEEAETSEEKAVSASYEKKQMLTLNKEQKLTFGDGMQEVTVEEDEQNGGLLLTGTGLGLSSDKITLEETFDFDRNAVGRLSFDGLAAKGKSVRLDFYLDDETEAFASVKLKRQKKAGKWKYDGDVTADVLEKNIQGSHTVSFQIVTEETEEMTILLRSIEFVESSLPVVYLDIDETEGTISEMNSDPEHETECYGDMTIQIPAGYQYEYEDKVSTEIQSDTYSMEYIRGRGNSTWECDKKPYKIKLEKKANLFGMGKNKHWVLLANRYDNSLLRNKATYWMGKELGMEYTPECVFVDVVMNGTYYGSYYLCEQVRVGSGRVEIDDLEDEKDAVDEPIISGGYLLSMCPYGDEEKLSFSTTRDNEFLIESPNFEDYKNDAQYNYIKNYVQKTEDSIYGKHFKLDDGTSYGDLMDIDSTVDYWWIQEISQNGDAFYTTSTYLYKKRDGKLYWGPLWDFDYVAWGDYDYSPEPDCEEFVQTTISWFERLFEDKDFAQRIVDRWPVMKETLESLCAEGGQLDQYYDQLRISQYYDYEKWGAFDFGQETPLSFKQEEERLKSWITKRVDWIDKNVNSLVPVECQIKYINNGKEYASDTVVSGKYLEKLPKPPTKKGYVFTGWYYTVDGEEYKLTVGSYISGSIEAHAKWTKKNKVKQVKNLYFEVNEDYTDAYNEYYMNYSVMPMDATITDVTWSTSNESIATVDENGIVTTLKPGTVKITGTCANGVKASYKLHVYDYEDYDDDGMSYYPETMELNKSSVKVQAGKYTKLTPKYAPQPCSKGYINWISLDEDIAEVTDAGVVIGIKPGTANILAFDEELDQFSICKVKVTSADVKKGSKVTVGSLKYKVTAKTKNQYEVSCIGRAKKSVKSVSIPSTVTIKSKKYKVVSVAKDAFNGDNITSVSLGSNIAKINQKAFYKCSSLSKLSIKSSKLKSVGKDAIRDIKKTAVINVPSKKKKAYKKLFKSSTGFLKKTMKIK